MSINEKLRTAGIIPRDAREMTTREQIVTMRNQIGECLAYLTMYDSDLADRLAAMPPEEEIE